MQAHFISKIKSTLLPIFLYLLFLFIFLETAARFCIANSKFFDYIRQGEYVSDSKWRLEWIKRKVDEKGNPKMDFFYAKHDPLLGWRLTPNIDKVQTFYEKELTTNSKGIRSKVEYNYQRPAGKVRILILGESFTFGTEVGDEETYPYYLQKILPSAEVINFGVFGYGFDQMLLYLKEEGLKYNPDIVIIPFLEIDKNRSLLGFRDYAKPYFVIENHKLSLKNVPIAAPEETYKNEFFRSKLIDIIKIVHRNILVKTGAYQKQEDEINQAIFHELVDTIKNAGAVPVFAYLQGIRDVIKKQTMSEKDSKFFEYWDKEGVHCIYLLSYIREVNAMQIKAMGLEGKTVAVQRKHGHFSPRENNIIAVGIKDYLSKNHLIP